jgi:hypothetical protein
MRKETRSKECGIRNKEVAAILFCPIKCEKFYARGLIYFIGNDFKSELNRHLLSTFSILFRRKTIKQKVNY